MPRLRQVALVARDLAAAEAEIAAAFDVSVCFRDPGVGEFGLHNALFALGDQFLEVVSPIEDDTTAGRLLDRRGDGGYMAIFQVDALAPVVERLEQLDVRIVFDARGDGIRGLHLHPRDVPGAIVSIDESDVPAAWPWAGSTWPDQPSRAVAGLRGITLSVDDPVATCATWAAVLGVDVDPGAVDLTVDDATVRFRPPRGDDFGITSIEVAAADGTSTPTTVVGVDVTTSDPAD